MNKNNLHPEKEQSKFDLFSKTIFNTFPGNCVVVNDQGKIVKVNLNWNKFAIENGIDPDIEWTGQNYLEVCKKLTGISNESAGEAYKAIKAILRSEESDFELEYPGQKSNKAQWFRMQATSFEFEGSFFATIIHQDITETKIQEFALKSSEKQFQTTFEQAAVGIAHISPEGSFLRVNQKFCAIVGYSQKEMLEGTFQDITHPDDLELDLDNVNKLLEGELETYSMEKRYFHKNGNIIWVNLTVSLVRTSAGKPDYFISVIEEITAKIEAENRIRESEEKFRSLMEQSPLSIQICDKDGNFVDGNKAWKQLWNISEEDMPYVKANYNILKDEEVKKRGILPLIEKAYAGEAVQVPDFFYESAGEMDAMGLAKEKAKAVWQRIKIYPVLDEAGDVKNVISIEEDITEHKQAENALKESEANFRDLVEQNPLYIEIYSPDGQLIHLNTAYKNLLAIDEDLSQMLYSNYNLFEDEYAIKNGLGPGIKNVFAGEYFEFNEYEFDIDLVRSWLQLENKNKGKLWFKATGFPIKDENGAIKQVVILSQDVSSRVTAEQGLIESEHKFRALFNTGGYAMGLSKMSDRRVTMVNQAWLALYGYSSEIEAIGSLVTDFIVPEERKNIKEIARQRLTDDAPRNYITKGLRKDNSFFDMEMRITTFEMEGEKYTLAMMNDITDRLEAEKKIRESEENYRTLIEQANDGIVLIQDGRVKFVNTALTRLTGYTVDELVGSSIFDYIEVNELEKVKFKYTKRMKGEGVSPYESKLVRKNGEIFEVEFNGGLTFYNGAVADLAMVRDITERKKAEEERNRLFNLSSDLIGIAGFDGIFNQINPAWETTLGYSLDQLMAKPFMDFIHPEDHEITGREMKKLAAGQTTINFENRYIHKDGSIIHISWTATPVVEESVLYCIGRDITEYKKHEEVLKESEEKFRMLVDQSPFSIQVFNPDGRIDRVNKAFTELWGVKGKELQEVLDNYNVLEDKEAEKLGVASAIQSVFRGGESIILPLIEYDAESTMDAAGVKVKANKQWIQARLYPVKNSKGEVVNVVDMEEDMTAVIQKEQEILNYQQRLKALSTELIISEEKQRRDIATDLHDHVGQLLASSRLQIATLSNKMTKQEIFEKLTNISHGLLQGIQATRNAIFELSPPQLNEIGLVAAVSDWMDEELETKHRINVNLTGDNKVYPMEGNIRILTFRCVRELLINVVKHAKATQVDLDIRENNKSLTIKLNDNGIGFNYSPALLRIKGSGFGLFSIHERIENIGGTIEIKSVQGKGTDIKLMIPLKD